MKLSEFLPVAHISHGAAWAVWASFALNSVRYILIPFVEPATNIQAKDWIQMLIFLLIIVSVLEAGVTILIRYFAIVKPYRRGTYNPHDRFARYFIVGAVNWLISNTVVHYGTILYYMSGIYWPHCLLSSMGIALLLYHTPRLGPFTKEAGQKEAIEAASAKVEP